MGIYNSYVAPPPPEPNPFPFAAALPAGTPGEHVPLFKVTPGVARDIPARPFQYAVMVEAMFAGAGENPERIVTAFGYADGEVSRIAGYHIRREMTAAHWDGTALVVSIVRGDGLARTYTGFLTSERLTHGTIIAMLA
jgi:hypothetical protein